MQINQPCNHKVGDFATAFRVRKHFGTFEKQAPEVEKIVAQVKYLQRAVIFAIVNKNYSVISGFFYLKTGFFHLIAEFKFGRNVVD